MSTPPDVPLVPPSAHQPTATGRPTAPQQEYAQPGWDTPEARALREAEAALRKARTALGWAIGASVGALIALVAAFAVPSVFAASSPQYADAGYPVNGTVGAFRPGGALNGVTLALAVENALYDDGSDVEGVSCPDTAAAQVSTVVACTGTFDDDDWTVIVYLLDEEGSILVTSY